MPYKHQGKMLTAHIVRSQLYRTLFFHYRGFGGSPSAWQELKQFGTNQATHNYGAELSHRIKEKKLTISVILEV